MTFDVMLQNLKRLHIDSENRFLEFNDIVPYEHNPNDVYSPILVNLMLQAGPQIENLVDLIINELKLKPKEKGLPARIREINRDGILSGFKISMLTNDMQVTPYKQKFSWWDTYNKTKHDLSKSQFKITYVSVVEILASLASLHRFADVLNRSNEDYRKEILNKQYWQNTFDFPSSYEYESARKFPTAWKSKVFRISNYFIYSPNV